MSVRTALATSIKDTSCCCAAPDLRLLFIHHTRPRLILHPPLITSRRPRPRPRPRRRSRSRPSPAPVRSFFFFTLWGFGTLKLPGRRIPAALRPLSFALSLRHHPRLSLPSGRHRQRHNPNKNNTYHTTVPTVHHHPRHPPTHSHTHTPTNTHTHTLSLPPHDLTPPASASDTSGHLCPRFSCDGLTVAPASSGPTNRRPAPANRNTQIAARSTLCSAAARLVSSKS